ncbi:MAG: MaoC family dehydratase N-terminal domain-containing protein [Actinomycetota bacterium]
MVNEAIVGKEFPSFELPVEKGKIKEFARSLGDRNPLYYDEEIAKSMGFRSVPAPPTFTATFLHHVPDEDFLLNMMQEMGISVATSVHGESEFEYLAPVCAGDVLTVAVKVKDFYQKEGKRGGKMNFITVESTYTNQEGVLVQKDRMLFIERESAA